MRDIPLSKVKGKLSSGLGLELVLKNLRQFNPPRKWDIFFDFENNMDNYFPYQSTLLKSLLQLDEVTNLDMLLEVYGSGKINWNFLNEVTEDLNFENEIIMKINTFATNTLL